jgi:hypothetical protein
MKTCTVCNTEKEEFEFYNDKHKKDGLTSKCKKCCKTKQIEVNAKRKDKIKEYYLSYSKNNKEKISIKNKKLYEKKKDIVLASCKQYRENNREKILEYQKSYYILHKEEKSIKEKEYRLKNRDKIRKAKNIYCKNRRKNDIEYRLRKNISSSIRQRMRRMNISKNNKKTIDIIGISIHDIKTHIDTLLKDEMTWNNYGLWHIDHIKPQCLFDFTDPEQIKECWALENLQPLWAEENFKKGSKV